MLEKSYDAIIVGGGHNGLVAATYLAKSGMDVAVLERRDFVGGACATEELFDGYRASSGSYVVWMLQDKVVRDLELKKHGFKYELMDPTSMMVFPDKSHIVMWRDMKKTQENIAKLNPRDAERVPAFFDFWDRAAGLVNTFMLTDPPSQAEVEAKAAELGETELLHKLQKSSSADIVEEYFQDERVQMAMAIIEDIGDPWAPGGAWVEAYFRTSAFTEAFHGNVKGGMGTITQAMARSAQSRGVHIEVNCPVSGLDVSGGRVCGVKLNDGRIVRAPIVLSNADPKRTMLGMVPQTELPTEYLNQVTALSTGTSYFKFHSVMKNLPDLTEYLGANFDPKLASYVTIGNTLKGMKKAFDQAMSGEPSHEPVVHLQIPTVYDTSLADKPGHVVSIWAMFAPPHLSRGTYEERRQEFSDRLIDYVTEYIPNFRDDMVDSKLFTPFDLQQRVGLTDGNIRHLDIIPEQFLDKRPLPGYDYQTPIEGLFLCSAGTHPGGEVTGAPGHNAAHAVLRAHG